MTVNELRETLRRLLELLRAADAKAGTVKDLTEFVELTAGFGDVTLKGFVKFAETGQQPPATKSTSGRGSSGAKSTADVDSLVRDVTSLYERAADPSVTEEHIRAVCGSLGSLKKDELTKVAAAIGLEGMKSRPKGDIATAISARILDRKGAAIRGHLVHRPPASASEIKPSEGAEPTGLNAPLPT